MPAWVVVVLVMLATAGVIFGYFLSEKRRKELAALARAWGFVWEGKDPFGIPERFAGFGALDQGHGHRADNVFHGERHGRSVICFDYRYRTGSGKNETTHWFSAALVALDADFPPVLIRPEGVLDRVAEFVGFDDIDFESAEFSRRFFVKSSNRKFAYDLLHARAMEHLLAQPSRFSLEFRGRRVLVNDGKTWGPAEFDFAVAHLHGLLDLTPEFLKRALQEGVV